MPKRPGHSTWWGSIVRVAVIVCASGAIAAVQVRVQGLDWVPSVEEKERIETFRGRHDELRSTRGISLERFQELIDLGAVVIDARPRDAFEAAHLSIRSIPPVLNVPSDEVDVQIERLLQLQGYPIVLYCTSLTCDFAEEVYLELERWGMAEMWIYFEGWEGLQAAQWPETSGPDTWAGFGEMTGDPLTDPNVDAAGTMLDPNGPDPAADFADPNAIDEPSPEGP